MHMVRLQIGQEKVKESVEVERQKLQEMADEVCSSVCLHIVWGRVLYTALDRLHRCTTNNCSRRAFNEMPGGALQAKEEVDRLSQLTKDRSTLAFGSAMVSSGFNWLFQFLGCQYSLQHQKCHSAGSCGFHMCVIICSIKAQQVAR